MRANTLVDVLLELNIVNLQDIDREINRLAASLYDPRAQSWFKRVARHWVLNIDWLKKPYTAKAEPRSQIVGGRPSDFYAAPSLRTGDKPGSPAQKLWPAWYGEQPPERSSTCQQCKGEGFTMPKGSTEPVKCTACKGTGVSRKAGETASGGVFCQSCQGTGKTKPNPEHPKETVPARQNDPAGTTCKACKGTGFPKEKYKRPKGSEGVFMPEWLVRRMLDEAEPEQPGYDPKARTYTTNLHVQPEIIECPACGGTGKDGHQECPRCGGSGKTRQRIDKDIEQNFSPFNPKKAKANRLHGEPPVKKELQPYMTNKEAGKKEFFHFDPIQVRRRDLFNRLQDLVNFLNWSYMAMQKPTKLSAEEMEDLNPEEVQFMQTKRTQAIADAQALFKKLEVMKADDIQGFREIMLKSEEFADAVRTDPGQFMTSKSGKVIARSGNLVLRKCIDADTAVVCGQKPAYNGHEPKTWCLKYDSNCESYLQSSPLYFVEKNGKAYVGIHPGSTQVKDTDNTPLNSLPKAMSDEVAPLLVNFPQDIPIEALRREAKYLADLVQKMRQAKGLY